MDIFALSPETSALVEALKAVPIRGQITYAELSAVLGRDVQQSDKLHNARRIALRDHGAAFETIRKVGLRRMHPDEAPDLGGNARGRIRNASRTAIKSMKAVVEASNGISPEAQKRLTGEIAALGLIAHLSNDKPTAQMAEVEAPLPPAKAARRFLDFLGAPVTE